MKKWREAVSTIIAAKNSPILSGTSVFGGCDRNYKEKTDFQILTLKKSSESPVAPGHSVFPGGTVSSDDSSLEWVQLFNRFGSLDKLCNSLNNNNTKLPIFENSFNSLPRCISLRITAIRETFEECGVLLCKKTASEVDSLEPLISEHLKIENLDSWRKKVLKNAKEFLNLCLHNDCYPDVSSLYLWSDWMTPSHFGNRFDSAIFIVFLENVVEAIPDYYEITSVKWSSPSEVLSDHFNRIHILHFPQLYESSRLVSFSSFKNLTKFAYDLNSLQSEVYMPYYITLKDGLLVVLPGDELYPKGQIDHITPKVFIRENESIDSFRGHQKMNRFIIPDYNFRLGKLMATSLSESSNHILPWSSDRVQELRGHL